MPEILVRGHTRPRKTYVYIRDCKSSYGFGQEYSNGRTIGHAITRTFSSDMRLYYQFMASRLKYKELFLNNGYIDIYENSKRMTGMERIGTYNKNFIMYLRYSQIGSILLSYTFDPRTGEMIWID